MKLPKTKLAAIKVGSITYYDGKICKHGHKGPKYVSAGCVECVKFREKKRRPIENERKRKKTIEKLKSIVRICKRRLCNNKFTPETKSDQVFCSERCSLIQGKEDWKIRNKKKYRISENIRKRKKYKTDLKYREKKKKKSNDKYHSMTPDEKFIYNKIKRAQENPTRRRKYMNSYINIRNKNDPDFKLRGSLRARVRAALKSNNTQKSFKTMELVGCTINQLWIHLEKQFKPGMTRKNHGLGANRWHVDHIIPVSKFDLTDPDQQRICFNFRNLQPLWQPDNFRKSNK